VSTPDTFRDALSRIIARNDFPNLTADAVLASDEMVAIRKALQVTIDLRSAETGVDRWTWATGIMGLPAHTAAWVLDDLPPDSPADKPCAPWCPCGRCHDENWEINGGGHSDPCPSCRGGEHQ
jgi:hypothetical protein